MARTVKATLLLGICAALMVLKGCAQASGVQKRSSTSQAATATTAHPPVATAHASADTFSPFPCAPTPDSGPDDLAFRAKGLSLSVPVDFMRLRQIRYAKGERGDWEREPMAVVTHAEDGADCPPDYDTAGCRDALMRIELPAAQPPGKRSSAELASVFYFLTRRGVAIRTWSGADQIAELLGPTDTPTEAWLWLMVHHGASGYSCGDAESSGYREVADGYELRMLAFTHSCTPLKAEMFRYHVNRAGQVSLLQRVVVSTEQDGCIIGG